MKDMKINAVIHQEVYIDPGDAFECIRKALGLYEDHDSFLCVKDGELLRGSDVSYHGSPIYEYETISNNPKWVELYKSVHSLEDYFKHSQEPQWEMIVENSETEEMEEDMTEEPKIEMTM